MHVQLKSICSAATGTALFGGQQDNELPCVSWAHLVTPLQVLVGGSTPERIICHFRLPALLSLRSVSARVYFRRRSDMVNKDDKALHVSERW